MALNQLLASIQKCNLCEQHLPLPAKPILQAHANSKILIAGQAPGIVTHEKGIPFDDMSGDRLRSWLGVDKATFYQAQLFAIVPMGFCYPGKGKSGDLPPKKLCSETWRAPLLSHLTNIELTIILGKYAIDWHLNSKESITKIAKAWQTNLSKNIVVLPHPSPRNNRWLRTNPWFEQEVIPKLQSQIQQILNS